MVAGWAWPVSTTPTTTPTTTPPPTTTTTPLMKPSSGGVMREVQLVLHPSTTATTATRLFRKPCHC